MREDTLERQVEDLHRISLRLSTEPRWPLVRNTDRPVSRPGEQAAHEAVPLLHLVDGLVHRTIHETEVAGVARNGAVRQLPSQPIEGPAVELPQRANTLSVADDHVNILVSLLPVSYTHLRAHETDSYL